MSNKKPCEKSFNKNQQFDKIQSFLPIQPPLRFFDCSNYARNSKYLEVS